MIDLIYVILVILLPLLLLVMVSKKYNLRKYIRYTLLAFTIVFSSFLILNQQAKIFVIGIFSKKVANTMLVDQYILEFTQSELVADYLSKNSNVNISEKFKNIFKDGLKRLDYVDLKTWRNIKLKTINNSSKACSLLITGKLTGRELFEETTAISNNDVDKWMQVMIKAASLEMKNAEYIAPSEKKFDKALSIILTKLNKSDRLRFIETYRLKQRSSGDDFCFVAKTLYSEWNELSSELEETYLRYLAQSSEI